MNTATSNKLILGCFCLCFVTMISSLYSIRMASDNGADKGLKTSIEQARNEIADLQKELIVIKKSLANPTAGKNIGSKIEEQMTSITPFVYDTYNLVIENNDQIMGKAISFL